MTNLCRNIRDLSDGIAKVGENEILTQSLDVLMAAVKEMEKLFGLTSRLRSTAITVLSNPKNQDQYKAIMCYEEEVARL